MSQVWPGLSCLRLVCGGSFCSTCHRTTWLCGLQPHSSWRAEKGVVRCGTTHTAFVILSFTRTALDPVPSTVLLPSHTGGLCNSVVAHFCFLACDTLSICKSPVEFKVKMKPFPVGFLQVALSVSLCLLCLSCLCVSLGRVHFLCASSSTGDGRTGRPRRG